MPVSSWSIPIHVVTLYPLVCITRYQKYGAQQWGMCSLAAAQSLAIDIDRFDEVVIRCL